MPSARSNSVKGSFFSSADFSNIALPSQLKIHQEVLHLISSGETEAVIEMIKKLKVQEIVGIRGLNSLIDDILVESETPVDTVMWNPLYFAVYYQNYDLVKFLIKDLKINLGLSAPKANADSERDAVNNDRYPEDKIMLLLLAYDRRDP
jgi:CRISPR/Cas system endoribonuclease Cas6 (RAMP superfamily)